MTRMVVVRALEYSIGADLSQPKAPGRIPIVIHFVDLF
jgi:hypothetical protein